MKSAILALCFYLSSVAPASAMYVWEDANGARHISTHPRNCALPGGTFRISSECWPIAGPKKSITKAIAIAPDYCGTKQTCGDMDSCEEAQHYLSVCGLTRLDGDGDGVGCDTLCEEDDEGLE